MADPIRLPGTSVKALPGSKVVPVARQKMENRQNRQKHDPREQPLVRHRKEPASAPPDERHLSGEDAARSPGRKKDPDAPDSRQGNVINIRI
jgi:hypothetical protein